MVRGKKGFSLFPVEIKRFNSSRSGAYANNTFNIKSYVSGFIDGEGNFYIKVVKSSTIKTGYSVQLSFGLILHIRELELIKRIQGEFSGVGYIGKGIAGRGVASIGRDNNIKCIANKKDYYPPQLIGSYLNPKGLIKRKGGVLLGFSSYHTTTRGRLHPEYVSGFIDAEGNFYVGVFKEARSNTGYSVKLGFQIGLHRKDLPLLEKIQEFFGEGIISKDGENLKYQVRSVRGLKIVIDHFDNYSLISKKHSDFLLFKSVFELVCSKQHLTKEGLEKIVALKASMNYGRLSEQLQLDFPRVTPAERPSVFLSKIRDPN